MEKMRTTNEKMTSHSEKKLIAINFLFVNRRVKAINPPALITIMVDWHLHYSILHRTKYMEDQLYHTLQYKHVIMIIKLT